MIPGNYQPDAETAADVWAERVSQATIRRLKELQQDRAWLAREMRVPAVTVSKILHGWPNLTLLTLARLSVALDLTLEDLLQPQNTQGDPPISPDFYP